MAKGLSRKITYAQARSYDRTVPNGIGVTSIAAVNGRGAYGKTREELRAAAEKRAAKAAKAAKARADRAYKKAHGISRGQARRAHKALKDWTGNPWVVRGDGKEEWIGPVRRKPYQGRGGATFGEAAAWRTKTEWDRESVGGDPTSYQQAYEATRRQLLSKAKKNGPKTEANVTHYEDNKRGRKKGRRRQSKKQRAASLRNLKRARAAQRRGGGASRKGRKRGRSAAASGHKYGPFRAVSATVGGKKRGTYAYRTTTGRLAHIPAWALAGGTSKKEVDAVWAGQITGPIAEKIMKRQQGIVARRARAAKRVTEHGDLFTPNDDGVKVISYDEWSKTATPNKRRGKKKSRKASKRKGRKYAKRSASGRFTKRSSRKSSRRSSKRGRKTAKRGRKTAKRGRRSSKRATVPVGHARHALSDLRGFIRNSAGSYDDMVTYEDNKRGKRKSRKAGKRTGRKAGKRRSYKRRGQTAAQRRASLRNLKKARAASGRGKRRSGKGRRKGSSKRKSSSRRRSSGKGKRHGVTKGSARKAWGTLKKYVGNKRGGRFSKNPFSSGGFMDRLKAALGVGAVVAGGFMAHRAVSKLLNDNVTSKYLPAALTEYSGIISGLIVAAAALPLVEKVIKKADTAALVTDGVWGSFIVGTAVAILNKLSQPTVAGYLSGYSVYDGTTRQYSGYGEYMEMKGMGEYMEMKGMGADYQAAAGYGADYQAAAGYGADYQAAAGMGADFQAAAGMGEYMATGAMGIGEYEAVRGLGAGPQYVREGIYPHQAEYALSVSEAASGIGDIGSQSTVLPGQVAEPISDVPDSMRSGVFKSNDGIFGA